ncbi:MAG: transporter, family, inner rane transport protein, partial [Pseudonocardiales bacterium]|nr:transporter, family, inner rane transport protein [Pseudonocardiales bacterium]
MLQTRLMDVARDGQSLAAALNHSTLNLANALGAWLGGVVLDAGLGYEWPSRIGSFLAVAALLLALISGRLDHVAQRDPLVDGAIFDEAQVPSFASTSAAIASSGPE